MNTLNTKGMAELLSQTGLNITGQFSNTYMIIFFLIIFFFYSLFIYYNNSYFIEIVKAFYNKLHNKKLIQKKNIIINKFTLPLLMPYFLILSLFSIILLNKLSILEVSIKNYVIVLIFLISIFILKLILYLYISYITNSNLFFQVVNNKIILLINSSLILSIMLFITSYITKKLQVLLIIGAILLFVLFEIINLRRNFSLIMNFRLYFFKNIFYFCAVEILPLLYGIKLFIKEVVK